MTAVSNTMGGLSERYQIVRPIGSGGMSEVFLAHDVILDRDVAIKKLRLQYAGDTELVEQFRREAKSAARLVHPNIINIYDVISDASGQYIVMEYVDGCTLKEYMKNNELGLNKALDLGIRLAEALQHAHSHNVIHCDIKPHNILLDKNLTPKIADFGIAKIVSNQTMVYTKSVMGSVHYISPEQASGEAITASSDVYSLGIVLFEMLTGKVPYTGDTAVAVAMMHVERPLPSLADYLDKVPKGLQEIIDRALAKRIQDRYASAGELRKDLLDLKMELFPLSGDDYEDGSDATKVLNARESLEEGATQIMPPLRGGAKPARSTSGFGAARGKEKAEKGGTVARKKRSFNFTKFIILLTLIVVLISLGAHYYFGKNYEKIPVPDVKNLTVVEAQKLLEDNRLKVALEEKYSATGEFRAGTVMEQIPEAGAQRKRGTVITLVISKGAELKAVPELGGLSLAKAEQVLEEADFKLGKVVKKHVEGERVGVILEQNPKGLAKAPKGSLVEVLVNEGDREVPKVIGKTINDARKLIEQAGLKVGVIRQITDPKAPKNVILSTSPDVGTRLAEGDVVTLTVAEGSAQTSAYVDFVVPKGKAVRVEIVVEDDNGRSTIYSGTQRGGVRLRQRVDYTGKAKVLMYCDDRLVGEKVL